MPTSTIIKITGTNVRVKRSSPSSNKKSSKKSSSKKAAARKAPAKSATEAAIGERRKGQDGKYWIVEAYAKGQRWVRQAAAKLNSSVKSSAKKVVYSVKLTADKPKQSRASGRKGPDVSATAYKIGYNMVGNDGMMWTIKADKNGRHRWVRV